jgi:hypothetical protein
MYLGVERANEWGCSYGHWFICVDHKNGVLLLMRMEMALFVGSFPFNGPASHFSFAVSPIPCWYVMGYVRVQLFHPLVMVLPFIR